LAFIHRALSGGPSAALRAGRWTLLSVTDKGFCVKCVKMGTLRQNLGDILRPRADAGSSDDPSSRPKETHSPDPGHLVFFWCTSPTF